MIFSSISDTGKVRTQNEDNYSNLITKDFSLFVVADGMGGHNAGEVASNTAVECIKNYILEKGPREDYSTVLENAVVYANNKILEKAKLNSKYSQMGTTVICALIADNKAYIAHLGDSRVYHLSDKKLKQITRDDSYVQGILDTGIEDLDKDFVENYKNIVTKALGIKSNIEINTNIIDLKKGDYILLVTDGLTNLVDDSEIEEVINLDLDIKEATEILVYMANSSGGFDNITVTLVKV